MSAYRTEHMHWCGEIKLTRLSFSEPSVNTLLIKYKEALLLPTVTDTAFYLSYNTVVNQKKKSDYSINTSGYMFRKLDHKILKGMFGKRKKRVKKRGEMLRQFSQFGVWKSNSLSKTRWQITTAYFVFSSSGKNSANQTALHSLSFVSQRLFVRPLLNQTPRRYSDYFFIFKIKSMSFSRKKQDTSVFHWVSLKTWRFIRTSVVFQNSSARSVSTHCFSITSAFDLESMCMETSF